jgi:hypothetical protein
VGFLGGTFAFLYFTLKAMLGLAWYNGKGFAVFRGQKLWLTTVEYLACPR